MPDIKVMNVSKVIKNVTVLQDINLSLIGGRIYGFIGKNGSGKTMLFRVISGLVKPTKGVIELNGNGFGIIIENATMYPSFTGLQNLKFLAGINNKIKMDDIIHAIQMVGLDPYDKRKVGKYSLGMKQRLAIAQAVMEKPDFLLLDEPTNALDIDGINLVRKIIKNEAERGTVILLASHNAEDISLLCHEIYDVKEGKVKLIPN